MSNRLRITALGATLALAAAGAAQAKTTITLSGSTSVAPLAKKLATSYAKSNKNVKFSISQGGSDIGIADVARGRVSIGMSSRNPQGGDPGGLTFTKVARDGVCVITHRNNTIGSLSQEQVQAIFSGQIRNWSEVPGAKATGPITLITRTASSGTADAFQNIFMGLNRRVAGSASQKSTSGLVQQSVASDPSAIGYVSFEFTNGVNAAGYKGVGCSLRNAKSGQYPGTRFFWMVTRGKPAGATKSFLNWIRGSAGQRIVANGWVPIR